MDPLHNGAVLPRIRALINEDRQTNGRGETIPAPSTIKHTKGAGAVRPLDSELRQLLLRLKEQLEIAGHDMDTAYAAHSQKFREAERTFFHMSRQSPLRVWKVWRFLDAAGRSGLWLDQAWPAAAKPQYEVVRSTILILELLAKQHVLDRSRTRPVAETEKICNVQLWKYIGNLMIFWPEKIASNSSLELYMPPDEALALAQAVAARLAYANHLKWEESADGDGGRNGARMSCRPVMGNIGHSFDQCKMKSRKREYYMRWEKMCPCIGRTVPRSSTVSRRVGRRRKVTTHGSPLRYEMNDEVDTWSLRGLKVYEDKVAEVWKMLEERFAAATSRGRRFLNWAVVPSTKGFGFVDYNKANGLVEVVGGGDVV